jgi:predicted acyl esterase
LSLTGEAVEITIETFPTANPFKAGHRVRIDIAWSNFPHFDVNPSTGEPKETVLTRVTTRNTVFVDAVRASKVVLPVTPIRE